MLILGLVLMGLDACPIDLSAGDPEQAAVMPTESGQGEVLVLVSGREIAAMAATGAMEASWAWLDLVQQEIGPSGWAEIGVVDAETLQSHRVVIGTRSALADEDAAAKLTMLRDFASNGGVLVLELPNGALRTEFAADGAGGWREPGAITAVAADAPAVSEALRSMPLLTRYMGSTRPAANAETLLAMDGAPVVYSRALGAGWVIVFDFDLGTQIAALQQGLPGPRWQVRARTPGDPVRTFDLVASPRLIGAAVPWADILERYVAHVVLGHHEPMFGFWPWPDGAHGGLIVSHDTRRMGGRPLWQSIHERTLEARTTTFIAAPRREPDEGELIADAELAGHAALLWVLDARDANLHQQWGVFGFEPVRQPLTLAGQLDRVERWLGEEGDVMGVRIWDGRWTSTFTGAYRAMEANELAYSVTYGTAPGAPPGYAFGTCQPFRPLDTNGSPFGLHEVPACFVNPRSDEERAALTAAQERAAAEFYSVHLLTAADAFAATPDMASFDAWRDALDNAGRLQQWIGGAGELIRFWRDRRAAGLRVISREVTARDADGAPRSFEISVEAETSTRGLTLMIPAAWGGMTLERMSRGGGGSETGSAEELASETVLYGGRELRLVALNPGFTTVSLRYSR